MNSMPKTAPFDNFPSEYDNWFVTNKFAFQSELNAIKKVLPVNGRGIEIEVRQPDYNPRSGRQIAACRLFKQPGMGKIKQWDAG